MRDTRKLWELITFWCGAHGQGLRDGENRLRWLRQLCEEMGDPIACELRPTLFTDWRADRVAGGAAVSTVNNALAYWRALFSELRRIGEWVKENPFAKVRALPRSDTELAYLSSEEIAALLAACDASTNADPGLVARICLSTRARWSEAEGLTWGLEHLIGELVDAGGLSPGAICVE